MPRMTHQECLDFLGEGARTGTLATVRADGSPHATPVWFLVEPDGTLILNTGATTAKGRNLRRDGRVSLVVDDPAPPFGFVRVDGEVELSEHADELLDSATRIAARYMGPALAERYGRRNAVPGELLVRVHPTRIVGERGVAD